MTIPAAHQTLVRRRQRAPCEGATKPTDTLAHSRVRMTSDPRQIRGVACRQSTRAANTTRRVMEVSPVIPSDATTNISVGELDQPGQRTRERQPVRTPTK